MAITSDYLIRTRCLTRDAEPKGRLLTTMSLMAQMFYFEKCLYENMRSLLPEINHSQGIVLQCLRQLPSLENCLTPGQHLGWCLGEAWLVARESFEVSSILHLSVIIVFVCYWLGCQAVQGQRKNERQERLFQAKRGRLRKGINSG